MKFTNKLFFNLFAVVMATMVFLACGKDDEGQPIIDKDNLVGTWLFQSVDVEDKVTNFIISAILAGSEITFESDGIYAIPDFIIEPIPSDSGTYTFDEKSNMLTFFAGGKDGTLEVRELSPTKLVMYQSDSDDLSSTVVTYSKKP